MGDSHHGHALPRQSDHSVQNFVDHFRIEVEVGLSNSMQIGSIASARAMANRYQTVGWVFCPLVP